MQIHCKYIGGNHCGTVVCTRTETARQRVVVVAVICMKMSKEKWKTNAKELRDILEYVNLDRQIAAHMVRKQMKEL